MMVTVLWAQTPRIRPDPLQWVWGGPAGTGPAARRIGFPNAVTQVQCWARRSSSENSN